MSIDFGEDGFFQCNNSLLDEIIVYLQCQDDVHEHFEPDDLVMANAYGFLHVDEMTPSRRAWMYDVILRLEREAQAGLHTIVPSRKEMYGRLFDIAHNHKT